MQKLYIFKRKSNLFYVTKSIYCFLVKATLTSLILFSVSTSIAKDNTNDSPNIVTAQVDEEYSCPLFENRPFDKLNSAVYSITMSIQNVPLECNNNRADLEVVQNNNKQIKDAVQILHEYYANKPDEALQNIDKLQNSLNSAVQGISNIGQIFSNSSLLNSNCGKQVMSSGKVLLAINDILSNLTPYALMIAALNPAASGVAKMSLMGGVFLTNSITAVAKLMDQRSFDMSNVEHRKAVLQNTCQYAKIARKVRYLQLAQSGQIAKVTEELESNVKAYQKKYSSVSSQLSKLISEQGRREILYKSLTDSTKSVQKNIEDLEIQLKDVSNDEGYLCLTAVELARQSSGSNQLFPASVISNLEKVAAQTNNSTKILISKAPYNMAKDNLIKMGNHLTEKNDTSILSQCSTVAKTWFVTIKQLNKMSFDLIAADQKINETIALKNEEYRVWKMQTQKIKQEKESTDRLQAVLKELAKDNSIIDRSELDQRMVILKSALFGSHNAWSMGQSPVLSWISHTADEHAKAIGAFDSDMKLLMSKSYRMTNSGQYVLDPKDSQNKLNQKIINDLNTQLDLSNFNLSQIQMGTREHELACQELETAWLDWTASLDHLGSIEFMCDMIDPFINSKIENGILKYCRGTIEYNGKISEKSETRKMRDRLTYSPGRKARSYRDNAILVSTRMNELQCPMPSSSTITGSTPNAGVPNSAAASGATGGSAPNGGAQ